MRQDDGPRLLRSWRIHWPVVLNLGIVVLIEMWIGRELNFGMTPFALVPGVDNATAERAWVAVLAALFVGALARYLSGATPHLPFVTWLAMGVFTLAVVIDVAELAASLVHPELIPRRIRGANGPTTIEIGIALLWDGALIWTSNVLLFTLWYWLLDGGGHEARAENKWERRDFLFPQQAAQPADYPNWHPKYLDYVYLAFCTSTALGPADTLTLSWRAKLLQMLQATMSLVVLALIVARAINILSNSQGGP